MPIVFTNAQAGEKGSGAMIRLKKGLCVLQDLAPPGRDLPPLARYEQISFCGASVLTAFVGHVSLCMHGSDRIRDDCVWLHLRCTAQVTMEVHRSVNL
jgi:hypothetical protein